MTTEPTELQQYRQEKDDFFRSDPGSPILTSQRDTFPGLAYYDERADLMFEIEPELFAEPEALLLVTSDGGERVYHRWARLRFTAEGQEASLDLFREPGSGHLFLPFRDATSGSETYGAGRYLEVPVLEGHEPTRVLLDFNYAYHPFCAYNEAFSCPLPPPENRLAIPIRAGERNP